MHVGISLSRLVSLPVSRPCSYVSRNVCRAYCSLHILSLHTHRHRSAQAENATSTNDHLTHTDTHTQTHTQTHTDKHTHRHRHTHTTTVPILRSNFCLKLPQKLGQNWHGPLHSMQIYQKHTTKTTIVCKHLCR